MDGYSVDTQLGRVFTGEPDSLFVPRSPRNRYPVILGHVLNDEAQFLDATNTPSQVKLAATLAGNGITCLAGQFGSLPHGNNVGNDEAMDRLDAAYTLLGSSKVGLYGASAGAALVLRWAMLNPSKVAAVYGSAPLCDINDVYVNNRGVGNRAAIEAAWDVTYPDPLPAGADLPGQAHLAAAIPCQLDYGTADPVIYPPTVPAMAAAWGSNCTTTVVDTTSGHNDTLLAKTDPADVFAFMVANGA